MDKNLNRRDFLKVTGLAAASLTLQGCTSAAKSLANKLPADRPNIILFISDDHGWAYSACYGNKVVRTPNIDRLATQGMRLTNAFAASPTCVPSRSVVYTGLMPFRNGAHPNHSRVKTGTKSLPHYLKKLGYRVILAGKTHIRPRQAFPFEYVSATLPKDISFDRRYRKEGIDPEAIEELLDEHVKNNGNQPLCLIIASYCPHVYWEPNKSYDPAKIVLPPYIPDTPATRAGMARYYSDITTLDKRVGQCLASVKKHSLEDNTLFIYTSDQGPEWPHAKWNLYDAGIRTPFIARWPGRIQPGIVSDAMISLVDITPTFIDLAGGKPIEQIDGWSFLPVLLGESKQHRQKIFATHTGDGAQNDFPMRCIRTSTHKYILNLNWQNTYTTHFTNVPGPDHRDIWDTWLEKAKTDKHVAKLIDKFQHRPAEELYDLRTDPYELNNIATDPANRNLLISLRKRVKNWMKEQGDPGLLAEK